MGCQQSRAFRPSGIRGQGPELLVLAHGLGLTQRDVNMIWQTFNAFDLDSGGTISINEFIVVGVLEQAEIYGKLIFRLWDSNASGGLDFTEFLCAVWSIASADPQQLAVFVHQLFDFDDDKVLDAAELAFVGNVLWGFRPSPQVSKAIARLDKNSDGAVSREEFVDKVRSVATIMQPAFTFKLFLQEKTLGPARWEQLTEKRSKLFGTKSMFDIFALTAHGIRKMKSGPLAMIRELSRSTKICSGSGATPPKVTEDKLEVAHEMVLMTQDRVARIKAKEKSRVASGKASLKQMHRDAIKLANSGSQIAFARDPRINAKTLLKGGVLQQKDWDTDSTVSDDSVQMEISMPKAHHLPEPLEPLQQNFVNRSSPAVAIWSMISGAAPGLSPEFEPKCGPQHSPKRYTRSSSPIKRSGRDIVNISLPNGRGRKQKSSAEQTEDSGY